MITLRQGKAKTILDNSINSAITAVETYNRPRTKFRIENYIILMVIAWTKLFHAYFQTTIGERYFYKEKNGRYKNIDHIAMYVGNDTIVHADGSSVSYSYPWYRKVAAIARPVK